MAVKRKVITYFLEDAAHEAFIRAVVDRLAREVGVSISDDPRSVVHGGRPIAELQRFLHDEQRVPTSPTDLLIIARDGNCHGPNERRREIKELLQRNSYHKPHVCAIPDPHIERWYLSDGDAVRQALSETLTPSVPAYKCERSVYKTELLRVIKAAGLVPIIGGAEHAEAIVNALDFYKAGKVDSSLAQFVEDARSALATLKTTG